MRQFIERFLQESRQPSTVELDDGDLIDVMSMMANPYRFYTVQLFRDNDDDVITARDIANYLEYHMNDGTSPERRDSIYLELHHTHLPSLVDKRVLEPQGRDCYTRGGEFERYDRLLTLIGK